MEISRNHDSNYKVYNINCKGIKLGGIWGLKFHYYWISWTIFRTRRKWFDLVTSNRKKIIRKSSKRGRCHKKRDGPINTKLGISVTIDRRTFPSRFFSKSLKVESKHLLSCQGMTYLQFLTEPIWNVCTISTKTTELNNKHQIYSPWILPIFHIFTIGFGI